MSFTAEVSPGKDKEANWLPAPKGKFILILRLYWPYEPPHVSILDASWKLPVVKMVQGDEGSATQGVRIDQDKKDA